MRHLNEYFLVFGFFWFLVFGFWFLIIFQAASSKAPPPSTVVAPVAEPNKEDEKPEEEEDQEGTPGSAIAGAASDELQARAAARAGEVDAEGGVATTSAGFSNVSINRDLFEIIYARAKILLSFMQIFSGFSMALERSTGHRRSRI